MGKKRGLSGLFSVVLAWLIGFGVSQSVSANTYYFHNDHLGTPQMLTDDTQTVVWKGEYDPFGRVTEDVSAIEQNLRFPGQYFDVETGLHYNYFRTYDPGTGRYVESDPIGLRAGMATYVYVGGNPISYFDPFGLEITGEWVQKPFGVVTDVYFTVGTGNARRPDDWWQIWNNLGTYKAMEHRVSVQAGYSWKIKCVDSDECDKDTWEIDGAWVDWMDIWIPVSTPAIPHPGGYYAFLARNAYSLLVVPATSQAMAVAQQAASDFEFASHPTMMCKAFPRS